MKQFLTDLTKNGVYYAEMLDNCAEIYINSEDKPVALLEFDGSNYNINFRCDLTSQVVAQITYDMTVIDEDIIIKEDFYSSPEAGLVYGAEALGLFVSHIMQKVEAEHLKQEIALDESVYVVQEPIYAYGKNSERKNRLQRLWGADLE